MFYNLGALYLKGAGPWLNGKQCGRRSDQTLNFASDLGLHCLGTDVSMFRVNTVVFDLSL